MARNRAGLKVAALIFLVTACASCSDRVDDLRTACLSQHDQQSCHQYQRETGTEAAPDQTPTNVEFLRFTCLYQDSWKSRSEYKERTGVAAAPIPSDQALTQSSGQHSSSFFRQSPGCITEQVLILFMTGGWKLGTACGKRLL